MFDAIYAYPLNLLLAYAEWKTVMDWCWSKIMGQKMGIDQNDWYVAQTICLFVFI